MSEIKLKIVELSGAEFFIPIDQIWERINVWASNAHLGAFSIGEFTVKGVVKHTGFEGYRFNFNLDRQEYTICVELSLAELFGTEWDRLDLPTGILISYELILNGDERGLTLMFV